MAKIVQRGKRTPAVRFKAMDIVKGLQQKDWVGEVKKIHAFVRDDIRYLRDIRGVETIQYPEKTLEMGQGDCDDKTILVASLLEAIGHPTRLVAVNFKFAGSYGHVYPETAVGNKWVAVETTEDWELGRVPAKISQRMIQHI